MTLWYVRHGPYGDRDEVIADTRDAAALVWSMRCGFTSPPMHEGRGTYRHEGTASGTDTPPPPTFRVYLPRRSEARGQDERAAVLALAARHARGSWAVRELTLTHPEHPSIHVGRADLVIITPGATCGYEIKTARDTLAHFPAQLPNYTPQFDAWHLAVATRHLAEARTLAPAAWGLIELEESGRCVVHRAARRGRGHFNVERLLWTLAGEDLLALFPLFFKGYPRKTTRAALITQLLRPRPDLVMHAALCRIRERGGLRMQAWRVAG